MSAVPPAETSHTPAAVATLGKPFTPARGFWLGVELFVLAGLTPLIVWYVHTEELLRGSPIYVLWAASGYCLWHLFRDPTFDKRNLWRPEAIRKGIKAVLLPFLVLGPALFAFVYFYDPNRFLALIKEHPKIMIGITFLYPIFSVYPQGIICRVFLLHRYRQLIPYDPARIVLAIVTFSYMHLMFENWIAIILTLIGGTLFTLTQYRHRSLLLSSIEHALYGIAMFASGLGENFFHGASRRG